MTSLLSDERQADELPDDDSSPLLPPLAGQLTRRAFLAESGTTGIAGILASAPMAASVASAAQADADAAPPSSSMALALRVNGKPHALQVDPRTTLLDLLREQMALPGTKKGCDHGQCGACTVLVNGRRINSCLALALSHDGAEITTIEGLARGNELHPMQAAFIKHDGFQCGYCTSGQICSAVGMLREAEQGAPSHVTADVRRTGPVAQLSDAEIRERMSGNICRCGAYPGIVAAVREVSLTMPRRANSRRSRA
ncbi:2Fe-2S iron-sulfur cluster-binding protein [Variovorax paradoxus]|uniref:2Fe-2S iron-sulfur cluster-binding protein n=1 Tax=Variovorax paradoxus TaxID=34073 RepID=UPI002785EAEE|nr:2Fe-2S iron-sulfur cluster-binding protein [Variovorax paradoxus]MDQ0589842.1 xanthine dehydrogenase YagT iron-sulfur-binding subunit [Variovorax paradoxus]